MQKNDTFMGDTLVPKPLTNAQVGNLNSTMIPSVCTSRHPTKVGTRSAYKLAECVRV